MTPEDIARIEAEFDKTHSANRAATLNRQDLRGWLQELDQQQGAINQALDGIEDLETFYDGTVKHYQQLRDEASDKKRKLNRDFDDCKRASIRISQTLRNGPQ